MTRSVRIISSFIGLFMLAPGVFKFFEPFKTMFTIQIVNSDLPLPVLTYWTGQLSEICVGLLLLSLLLFWHKIPFSVADKSFYLGNMIVIFIMMVAIYVHLHPDVPANVLPMEKKPPYLAVLILFLAGLNFYFYSTNKKQFLSSGNLTSAH